MEAFIKAFYTKFPEYKNRKLILAGESYAGKYLPHIANQFYNVPEIQPNLQSVLIGDPFTSPLRQRLTTHLIAKNSGISDPILMHQVEALRRRCEKAYSKIDDTTHEKSAGPCLDAMNYIDDMAGGIFTYDGTIFESDWDAQQKVVEDYLGSQN